MTIKLSRREFLKLGGTALAGVPFIPLPPRDRDASIEAHLGRIAEWTVYVRQEPSHSSPVVRTHRRDDCSANRLTKSCHSVKSIIAIVYMIPALSQFIRK